MEIVTIPVAQWASGSLTSISIFFLKVENTFDVIFSDETNPEDKIIFGSVVFEIRFFLSK